MRTKATLKKISQNLNLSISTVSRALKNHPDISEETKRKVIELAGLMEYEPNTHAINLRTNKSKVFGLMVPVISNYFYYSLIAAVEEDARRMGYTLLILQSGDDPQIEAENLRLCRMNRVAGVFVSLAAGTKDISHFLKLDEMDIPVIFFDKVPDYEACNKICLADSEAARLAAETIVRKNKKKIFAIFGNPELLITQKRLAAFKESIESTGENIVMIIQHASSSDEAFIQTTRQFSQAERPDTIFTMSDEILTGVMKALQRKQILVPDEVGVISICNDNFIPSLYFPEITFVETSGRDLGKLAFKRMMDHMGGKTFLQELTLPSRLISGGSL